MLKKSLLAAGLMLVAGAGMLIAQPPEEGQDGPGHRPDRPRFGRAAYTGRPVILESGVWLRRPLQPHPA